MSRSVAFVTLAMACCLQAIHADESDARYLEIDSDQIYFEIRGSGSPVVLVSGGSGMDLRQWTRVAEDLSAKYRVVSFDPRGVGRSDTPTVQYSNTADIAALLDHLEIESAIFVGLSSAGGLVLEFGVHYPERVSAIVAAAPFITGWKFSDDMQARVDKFSAAASEGKEPFLDAMLGDAYFIPAPLDPGVRDLARQLMGENYELRAGFDPSLPIAMDPPLIRRLDDIAAPVMLVVGELEHPDVRRRNRFLMGQVSDVREVVIRDAGHNTPLENRRAFVGAITPFLERHSR